MHVHDHQVELLARHLAHRLTAVEREHHIVADAAQHAADHQPVDLVIVGQQQPAPDRLLRRRGQGQARLAARAAVAIERPAVIFGEGRVEPEGRSPSQFALDPDAAAHRLGEAPGDGEAEAGPAMPAGRGGVALIEGLEQIVPRLGRHAGA